MSRIFKDELAVRSEVPLLVGLVGPSGGGKTFSALRLATGIQSVSGGDIGYIDTEANRALHYADKFKFRHLPFGAPFGPLDYLAAIQHFEKKGVKITVVDSMSHEHEGPGGVLEMHENELVRIGKGDAGNFLAWAKPKGQRRKMINAMLQMKMHFIFCFRAKEKIKLGGAKPISLGWQPIGGEEYVFEMSLNCLLLPGANGIPTWSPEEKAEKQMIKLPEQFKRIFAGNPTLDENVGRQLAEWAKGGPVAGPAQTKPEPAAFDLETPAVIPSAPEPELSAAEFMAVKSSIYTARDQHELAVVGRKIAALTTLSVDQRTALQDTYREVKPTLLK